MLVIKVNTSGFKPFKAMLEGLERQLPFAAASALTATAKDAQRELQAGIQSSFERPVPFTVRGVGITPANKVTLTSAVFLMRKQTAYLEAEVLGGTRRRKPFEAEFSDELAKNIRTALPGAKARLTAAGNISQREITRMAAEVKRKGGKMFAARPGGHLLPGIYERVRRTVRPLLIFRERPARYRKRFDFYGIAQRTAERRFAENFERAWQRAVATAR